MKNNTKEHEHNFTPIAYSDGSVITQTEENVDMPFAILRCDDCGTYGHSWLSEI